MASSSDTTFRSTSAGKLLYWSSETSGDQAKTVNLTFGKVEDRAQSDRVPRAFRVFRR